MTNTVGSNTEWIEYTTDGWRLVGSRCTACGAVFFPAATACADCAARGMERTLLHGDGTVVQKTTIGIAPPGFEAPYGLAWVDLDAGPRAFGQVDDPSEVKIGDRVTLAPGTVWRQKDGTPVIGHRFRKVR